jgi:hypothetical protein
MNFLNEKQKVCNHFNRKGFQTSTRCPTLTFFLDQKSRSSSSYISKASLRIPENFSRNSTRESSASSCLHFLLLYYPNRSTMNVCDSRIQFHFLPSARKFKFDCVKTFVIILLRRELLPSSSFFLSTPTVVAQSYKVDVETLAASRGCTAILRCVVPSFVKELVRVVSWVQEPAFFIYPSLQGGKSAHNERS